MIDVVAAVGPAPDGNDEPEPASQQEANDKSSSSKTTAMPELNVGDVVRISAKRSKEKLDGRSGCITKVFKTKVAIKSTSQRELSHVMSQPLL